MFFLFSNIGDYAADGNIDNIVTHLLNQFENSGQTETLTPEDIAKLPMTTVNEKQVENGTQCATCMEVFLYSFFKTKQKTFVFVSTLISAYKFCY